MVPARPHLGQENHQRDPAHLLRTGSQPHRFAGVAAVHVRCTWRGADLSLWAGGGRCVLACACIIMLFSQCVPTPAHICRMLHQGNHSEIRPHHCHGGAAESQDRFWRRGPVRVRDKCVGKKCDALLVKLRVILCTGILSRACILRTLLRATVAIIELSHRCTPLQPTSAAVLCRLCTQCPTVSASTAMHAKV
jgi:hypothetical protein